MRLIREEEIREQVGAAFDRHREVIADLLPEGRVEHIGSTAVPGSLTKGDLDICVVVARESFDAAVAEVGRHYEIHQPENWTADFASFVAPAGGDLDAGVQVVVSGTAEEAWFLDWRERLRADPALRRSYDDLKLRHAAEGMDGYREAKERLILRVVRGD